MNININTQFRITVAFRGSSSILIIKGFRIKLLIALFVFIEVHDGHVFIWSGRGGAPAHD